MKKLSICEYTTLDNNHLYGVGVGEGCCTAATRVYFLPRHALAEFQHVNCIIVQNWEVKRVANCVLC